MTTPLHAEPVAVEPVSNRYKLVPVAPTLAMIEKAVHNCAPVGCCLIEPDHAQEIWSAMLAAAPAPDGLREAVWQAVMLGGDAWGITDRVIALLAASPAHEGKREAVEIVTEWLAMAEAVPTQTHGVLRYPPISQGELDAIALLAKGEGT